MTASSMVSPLSLLHGLLLENACVVSAIPALAAWVKRGNRERLHVHRCPWLSDLPHTRDNLPKSMPQPMEKDPFAARYFFYTTTIISPHVL